MSKRFNKFAKVKDPYSAFDEEKAEKIQKEVQQQIKELQEQNNKEDDILMKNQQPKKQYTSFNSFDAFEKKQQQNKKMTNVKQSKYYADYEEPDFNEEKDNKDPFYYQAPKVDPKEQAKQKKKEEKDKKRLEKKQENTENQQNNQEQQQKQKSDKQKEQQEKQQQKLQQKQLKEKQEKQKKDNQFRDNICIIVFISLLFFGLCYLKFIEEKYAKYKRYNVQNKEGIQEDLYEILQIDPSASTLEIKKKGKQMALLWHPDKNPNCGQECDDKFRKVMRAYEILSVEETRKSYDETAGGVITPIKSKAIPLTPSNYDNLIEDSQDIWIIQVYEDGDQYCEHFSGIWEQMLQEYGGTVKFARINMIKYKELVKQKLPINIVLIPTVIAFIPGQEYEIFTPNENVRFAYKNFIESCLNAHVQSLDQQQFQEFFDQDKEQKNVNNKLQVMLLGQSAKAPFMFQYYIYKYNQIFDLYFNTMSNYLKLKQFKPQQPKPNVAVAYTNYNTNKRNILQISFDNKIPQKVQLIRLFQLVKFTTLPEINKSNFQEYCEILYTGDEENTQTESDSANQPLCILVQSQNDQQKENLKNRLQQYISEIMDQILPNINTYIKDKHGKQSMFQHFQQVQMGFVDLKFHKPFNKIVQQVLEKKLKKDDEDKPADTNDILAIALLPSTQKIVILTKDKISSLENWLDDVLDENSKLDYYYLNEFVGDHDIRMFLYSENFTLFTAILKEFISNLINYQLLLTLSLGIGVIFYIKKNIDRKPIMLSGLILYLSGVVMLSYLSIYEKYLNY